MAATQAKDPGTTLHYLRTSNPLNPENLAVYPKRLPTNRPNPYRLPGGFDELPKGLPVYEDRQCNAANLVPTITNTPLTLVNDVVGPGRDRGPDGRGDARRAASSSCRRSGCRRSRRCRSRPSRPRR